ncbi:citrate synthase [Favolaschia claudopus]|uniref:Citrate synthase n=1 Tax=Favolaschia claudopus TaxID=2862362 RepID=A0AAW0C1X8_9AGAR
MNGTVNGSAHENHTNGTGRTIFDAVSARIPSRAALAVKLMTKYRDSPIQEVTVENVMNGMRGLQCILWEISETGATGIRHHGKSLQELEALLPKWPGSTQMSPEAMLWYLYTATVPTPAEVQTFAAEISARAELPLEAQTFFDSLPTNILPEAQVIMMLTFLSQYSKFNTAVSSGVSKDELWRYSLEDALDVAGRIPLIVGRAYAKGKGLSTKAGFSPSSDLAHNFARLIGKDSDLDFIEFTRLCWCLYLDHGSSVSSHAMRLVGSAWSEPYTTIATGIVGGTGPLHAKAIADSVNFNLDVMSSLGAAPTKDEIFTYVGNCLTQGQIIPGYGHALLRVPDPRLELLRRFLDTHPSSDPKVHSFLSLIRNMNDNVPDLLRERVRGMKNPHPNGDALNGCILHAYGLPTEYLLCFFACSRAMGFMSQYIWDRALGLSMERPLSLTMDELLAKVQK